MNVAMKMTTETTKHQPLPSFCSTESLSGLFDDNLLLSRKETTRPFMVLKMCSEPDSCVWFPINGVKDIMFIKTFCLKNTSYNKNDRGRHIANSGEKKYF